MPTDASTNGTARPAAKVASAAGAAPGVGAGQRVSPANEFSGDGYNLGRTAGKIAKLMGEDQAPKSTDEMDEADFEEAEGEEKIEDENDQIPDDDADDEPEAKDEADDEDAEADDDAEDDEKATKEKPKKKAAPTDDDDDETYLSHFDAGDEDEADGKDEEKGDGKADDKDESDAGDDDSIIPKKIADELDTEYSGVLADAFKSINERTGTQIKKLMEPIKVLAGVLEQQVRVEQLRALSETRSAFASINSEWPELGRVFGESFSGQTKAQQQAFRAVVVRAAKLRSAAVRDPKNPRYISMDTAIKAIVRRDHAGEIAKAEARKKAAEPKQSRNVRFSSGTQREQVKKKKGGAGGVDSLTNAIKEQFGAFLEKD